MLRRWRDLLRAISRRLELGPYGFVILLTLGIVHEWYVHAQIAELQAENIARTALRWRYDDTEAWIAEYVRRRVVWENENDLTHLAIPSASEVKASR